MKRYSSKFGYETVIFMTILYGGILGFMMYQKEPLEAILTLGGIFFLTYLFILYVNFSTQYIITNNRTLIVKCGFFYKKELEILKIKTIDKTNTLVSSPATSLDRIELTYGKFNSLIISPKDKIGFAKELTRIHPEIKNNVV